MIVEARGLKMVKKLRFPVDPATASSTYVNGVLCVRVAKRI